MTLTPEMLYWVQAGLLILFFVLASIHLIFRYMETRKLYYLVTAPMVALMVPASIWAFVIPPLVDPAARRFTLPQARLGAVWPTIAMLVFGGAWALGTSVVTARRLASLRAAQRAELEKLRMQALAAQSKDAALTVEALTQLIAQQGRAALWQNVLLSTLFYVLGVLTPLVIAWLTSQR
jgi:hypothetical protein